MVDQIGQMGTGTIVYQQIANPGAGLDFTFTPPTGCRWRIQSLLFTLTTAVAVASRRVEVRISSSAGTHWIVFSRSVQAALLVYKYLLTALGGQQPSALWGGMVEIPISPEMRFNDTVTMKSVVADIQAADVVSDIFLTYERWATGE
jgi:hypothetical protein